MQHAETRDRAGDLQIFSLTLSQLSYRGCSLRVHAAGRERDTALANISQHMAVALAGRLRPKWQM